MTLALSRTTARAALALFAFGALVIALRFAPGIALAIGGFERHTERVTGGGEAGLTVAVRRVDVLVLDDHPLATEVAERLAEDLRRRCGAAGVDVRVHTAASAPFVSRVPGAVDVLALVDRVHTVQEDFGVFHAFQVRLNVSIGRPPRALEAARAGGSWHAEYSIDAHFDQLFGGPRAAEQRAADTIEVALGAVLDQIVWRGVDAGERAVGEGDPAVEAGLPPWLPPGALQCLYDVVHADGTRERVLQLDTAEDWRQALSEAAAAARGAGWSVSHCLDEACAEGLALQRDGARVELCLAYMQHIPRVSKAQRQVLTVRVVEER